MAAHVLVFPIVGGNRRQVVFSADDDGLGDHNTLPDIEVRRQFQNQGIGVVVHRARVTVGKFRFLIYGYTKDRKQVNRSLRIIRPSSKWHRELVIFQLGTRVPLLSRFTARKGIVDIAVTMWVLLLAMFNLTLLMMIFSFMSRVTEAYDIGRRPPTRIEVRGIYFNFNYKLESDAWLKSPFF